MYWIKKYAKEIGAIAGVAAMLVSMTAYIVGSIHGVETRMIARMDGKFTMADVRFSQIEKDLTIIKTVLIMKNIMPQELAVLEEKPDP